MSQTNILIFGATGYIAGTLLLRLLKLSNVSITVLVRSAEKAEKLRKLSLGLKVVEGSPTTDAALLVDLLKDTDLLIDSYNCDDFVGGQHIAAALRKSEKKTRVIHVSGTGVLMDDALGRDIPNKVWDDANVEEMASLEITRVHRNVDLEFIKADEDGAIYSYLVLPGAIFARPSGVLVDAGIQDADGKQHLSNGIPQNVITLGEPVIIGEGLNRWSIVELYELTDFLMILVTKLLSSEWEQVPHGKEGYFFVENGSVQLREVALTTARAMTGKAVSKTRPITEKELTNFGYPEIVVRLIGGNTRCVSTRARRLGWAPVKGEAEFLKEVETYTLDTVIKKK
ncbi:NAD(P)-binding protein [Hymenopellis radicata]|nr:NAD(P)-binding protein [Hymenopellis radicata]